MQRAQWTQHPQNRAWQVAPLLLALLLMLPVSAFAQVNPAPSLMNFQGRLAKPDGTPIADGAYSIKFSLFDALANGNQKWTQAVGNVSVHNGTFAVLLSGFPAGTFDGDLWLEIKVGNDNPLTPRQQLVSVAYAFKANTVPDGSITAAKLAPGANTPGGAAGGDLTGTYPNPTLANLATSLSKVSGSVMTSKGGNIGIGTNAPAYPFDLNGAMHNTSGSFFGIHGETTTTNGNGIEGYANTGSLAYGIYGRADSGYGVYGLGGNYGVYGSSSNIGVYGDGSGTGVSGSGSVYGVSGTSVNGGGVFGGSTNGTGVNGSSANFYGVFGSSPNGTGVNGSGGAYGVAGNSANIGVYGFSAGAIGVKGVSTNGSGLYASGGFWGIEAYSPNIAIYGKGSNYGVEGYSAGGYGVFGNTASGYAVYANGAAGGTTGWANVSDARYKTNVQTLPDALDTILNLRGVHFEWRRDEFQDKHFPAGRQVGFIAQEIEKVLPGLVYTDKDGYKAVAYANVVPVLVEAVKTLKRENETKEKRLSAVEAENAKLKARIEAIEQTLARGGTQRR